MMDNRPIEEEGVVSSRGERFFRILGAGFGLLVLGAGGIILIYVFLTLVGALYNPDEYAVPVIDSWQHVLMPETGELNDHSTELEVTVGQGQDFYLRYGPAAGDLPTTQTLNVSSAQSSSLSGGGSPGFWRFVGILPPLVIVFLLLKIGIGLLTAGRSLVALVNPWEKLYNQLVKTVEKSLSGSTLTEEKDSKGFYNGPDSGSKTD